MHPDQTQDWQKILRPAQATGQADTDTLPWLFWPGLRRVAFGPALLTALATASFLILYELCKQYLFPRITVWQSHEMTILATAAMSGFAAHVLMSRQDLLNRRAVVEQGRRLRAEEDMTRHVSFQKLLLEAIGEAVYCLDREGNTVFVNEVAEAFLGWKAEELLGKPIHSLVHGAGPDGGACDSLHCRISPSFHPLIPCQGIEMFRTKDGCRVPVKFVVAPLIEQGRMSGAIVAFHAARRSVNAESSEQPASTENAGRGLDGIAGVAEVNSRIRSSLDEIARMTEKAALFDVTSEQRVCLEAVLKSTESVRQIVDEIDSASSRSEAMSALEDPISQPDPGDANTAATLPIRLQ